MSDRPERESISRRSFMSGAARAAFLTLLGACAPPRQGPATAVPTPDRLPAATATASATATATSVPTPIPQTPTREIPLVDKIAQMVLVGFRGLVVTGDSSIAADLTDRHIGGVVLFDKDLTLSNSIRNIQSPRQVKALTAQLQQRAAYPLLISTDQEGGEVARLSEANGFPATLSEQAVGKLHDPAKTLENAETIAKALAAVGINLNLAPVVDLNVNPLNPVIGQLERSFSADPDVVVKNALAEIGAHHKYGVLTTLKHFPGHGSSRSDSHLGFVDVTTTWSEIELEPYRQIIAAGQADAIMTAHIFNARLDPNFPATLSRPIITGILREQLRFDGVVISDDMQMGAIAQYYGLETAVEKAIDAGVDILAIANNLPQRFDPAAAEKVIAIIENLVATGRVSAMRIDESYRRIIRLKGRLA